jgi:hypothetical protein
MTHRTAVQRTRQTMRVCATMQQQRLAAATATLLPAQATLTLRSALTM